MGSLGSKNEGIKVRHSNGIEEESIQEGENAFIVAGTSIMVWVAGEGIGMVRHAGFMDEVDIVVTQGENVAGKMAIDFLRAVIVLKVLMVGEDVNDKLSPQ